MGKLEGIYYNNRKEVENTINNIQKEKCICCNGTGKEQIFNDYK